MTTNSTNLHCSVHPKIIGKAHANWSAGGWQRKVKGIPLDRFIKHLNEGHAWSPAVYIGGQRSKNTFYCSNVFAVDIDAGLPLATAISRFSKTAALIYTSASHQRQKGDEPPCDRYRIIFVCEEPITSAEEYELVLKYLMQKVPECDKSCSDCSRFYFGPIPNTNWQHFVFNNVIKQERINEIIGEQRTLVVAATSAAQVKADVPYAKQVLSPLKLKFKVEQIKYQLQLIPDHIENKTWVEIAAAIVNQFGEELGNQIIMHRWPNNTRYIKEGEFKSITFGTFKYWFKHYLGDEE